MLFGVVIDLNNVSTFGQRSPPRQTNKIKEDAHSGGSVM